MTYVNINTKDMKELLKEILLDTSKTPQEQFNLYQDFMAIFDCIQIEDEKWDDVMIWLDENINPKIINKLHGRKTTAPRAKSVYQQVNAKKMIGKLPNVKKNIKKISF